MTRNALDVGQRNNKLIVFHWAVLTRMLLWLIKSLRNDATTWIMTEILEYGTHLRVLSESYPMNTNMIGFIYGFQKSLRPCALDKSSLIIGRVNPFKHGSLLDMVHLVPLPRVVKLSNSHSRTNFKFVQQTKFRKHLKHVCWSMDAQPADLAQQPGHNS